MDHPLSFGTFLTPSADRPERVVALAQLTEQVGLDLVSVQDHPYQARHLDAWTLLSVIAASTSRVTVAPNVANLPLRPPAVLARSVATLDLLSGGRVELGLGAGAFRDAIAAVGGPRLTAGEGVDALAEGIAIIRAMWDPAGGPVKVDGTHHRVWGAHPGPAPAHDVGIWVGSYKPRMLALTGRLADGWLPSSPYAGPEVLPELARRIDEAAVAAGRDPAAIRRLYNVTGTFSARATGFLRGPAGLWADQLIDVHDSLRAELSRVRDLVDQVTDGALDPGAARDDIHRMTLRQNNWTVGVYCESYCRVVTAHHGLEDRSVFPHLRAADDRLAPVLDRLQQEHHTIHDVLEGVDRALVGFVADSDGTRLRAAVDLLTDTLLSHLSYEERELVEPLARLGFY